jgi:hypothetical protein
VAFENRKSLKHWIPLREKGFRDSQRKMPFANAQIHRGYRLSCNEVKLATFPQMRLPLELLMYEGKSVNKSQKAMKKILSEIFT